MTVLFIKNKFSEVYISKMTTSFYMISCKNEKSTTKIKYQCRTIIYAIRLPIKDWIMNVNSDIAQKL